MYSRMSSGPSWSVERWKYCANYTPMLSEQSACRMISRSSFPDRELLVDFARYVMAERGAMCPRSAVADSLEVTARFRKLKPTGSAARSGQRNRTQTGMI
jgi:hypothetical protein